MHYGTLEGISGGYQKSASRAKKSPSEGEFMVKTFNINPKFAEKFIVTIQHNRVTAQLALVSFKSKAKARSL